jgi:hypothetical protein
VPLNGPGEQVGLLTQFLGIVLAKVAMGGGGLVEGENVVCWLQLGYGDEPNLSGYPVSTIVAHGVLVTLYTDVAAIGDVSDALLDDAQLGDEGLGAGRINLHFFPCLAHLS